MKYMLAEMASPDIKELAKPGSVVVVPVGAIEQHGPHLPVDTDARLAEAIVHRAAELTGDVPVLVAPTVSYGISGHHMDFSGTMALSALTFINVVTELTMCLVHHGFKNILWMNGHGGNNSGLYVASQLVREQAKVCMAVASWASIASDEINEIRESKLGGICHACELETSTVLYLRPDLVHMERAEKTIVGLKTKWMSLDGPRKVELEHKMIDFTPKNGVMGDPTLATTEKGRRFFEAATKKAAEFLVEFSTWDLDTLSVINPD